MYPDLRTHPNQGFTLIEILVSVVILAIGLLGLATLQTLSLKDNQDAYLYSQASALAYDMSDRIKANASGWTSIPTPAKGNECNSTTNTCAPTVMAAYDYYIWQKNVTNKLVGGSGTVAFCSGSTTKLCISLAWTGGHQGSQQFPLEVQL